ncbi:hypothetical protein BDW69DRAFT_151531 [Aspergillus filifer]
MEQYLLSCTTCLRIIPIPIPSCFILMVLLVPSLLLASQDGTPASQNNIPNLSLPPCTESFRQKKVQLSNQLRLSESDASILLGSGPARQELSPQTGFSNNARQLETTIEPGFALTFRKDFRYKSTCWLVPERCSARA